MEAKTQVIHARMTPQLKHAAEEIFAALGLSSTDAIRLFFKQVELHRGLPFDVRMPNAESTKALRQVKSGKGLKRQSVAAFKKSLGNS
ncbi:MAG: type II toxin-antitoxin system RelB/DinJ family antitoxin [Rickettsiales bacterium]